MAFVSRGTFADTFGTNNSNATSFSRLYTGRSLPVGASQRNNVIQVRNVRSTYANPTAAVSAPSFVAERYDAYQAPQHASKAQYEKKVSSNNTSQNIPQQQQQQQQPVGRRLPSEFYQLTDPEASAQLPQYRQVDLSLLDNRELDKLVSQLGRNKNTWRRALLLHEWLVDAGHIPDDRLCTTLIRVCGQHGQTFSALGVYEWMKAPSENGGAGLCPSVYTYTAAMRAALAGNVLEKALQIWNDVEASGCTPDSRLCTAYIEVCTRMGQMDKALAMYYRMRNAPANSKMSPTVHAYTAAMRAATEGGLWAKSLEIWQDMVDAGVQPSGHAFAAAISSCAAGGEWQRACNLFEMMLQHGIQPDVVSCTALISALATGGQWQQSEQVVSWMLLSGVRPNVRTYTALLNSLGHAQQWQRAVVLLSKMSENEFGCVEPNAYCFSALLKALGEHGQWEVAEQVFSDLEGEILQSKGQQQQQPNQQQNQQKSATNNNLMNSASLNMIQCSDASSSPISTTLSPELNSMNSFTSNMLDNEIPVSNVQNVMNNIVEMNSAMGCIPQEMNANWNSNTSVLDHMHHHNLTTSSAVTGCHNSADTSLSFNNNGIHSPTSSVATMVQSPSLTAQHLQQQQISPDLISQFNNQMAIATASEYSPTNSISSDAQALGKKIARPRHGKINEVVCGALMMAYSKAGKWSDAVKVLSRARRLGIKPNTVMYNSAISAAGKSGQLDVCEQLFNEVPEPDAVTYETVIAAYGMAGNVEKAESIFQKMLDASMQPRDYAYCGLIAAHSMAGDWQSALNVRARMQRAGVHLTVHVYNALIAACERCGRFDHALQLHKYMESEGIEPNNVTISLLNSVGKQGIRTVEHQQLGASALSAAVAAAGALMIHAGIM